MKTNLIAYLNNPSPTIEEAYDVFYPLTNGEYDDVHITAILATIRTRGETFADIAGAARAFIDASREFPITGDGILDTAGTGGDGTNTFNISTGASLIAAAGGTKIIKCGNRSVSSKSGSADVLEALNIPLDLDIQRAKNQFQASNFTFLFAPAYHPAVAHVMPVRRALKIPTIFNTLGPILSPAKPEFQIMGVANPHQGNIIAQTFRDLGRTRALVVHGAGTDEVAVHGNTLVWELNEGEISHYELTPSDLGTSQHSLSDLVGGNAKHNARILRDVLAGKGTTAQRDALAANAGAMFYVTGSASTFREGTERAKSLLADGTAHNWITTHEETNYASDNR